jgi:hypothetical protein
MVYTQVGFLLSTLHYPPQSPPYKGGKNMDCLPPLALSERLRQRQGEGWGGVMQGAQT